MNTAATPIMAPRLHKLKCLVPHFGAVCNGTKRAEVRLNDRNYLVNDLLLLCEVLPREEGATEATGREVLTTITHVLPGGQHGLDSQYVVLSIALTAEVPTR